MTKIVRVVALVMTCGLGVGCADPSEAEICGQCEDELETQCEDDYQVCLEADEGECFDALEEFYADEC